MGRWCVTVALLIGLLTSGGCCWWCERHCPHSCAAYPQAAYPAPMCCPNTSYQPYQPVAAPAPSFNQPRPPMHCECTCTP
jgi:hypothetical protein